MYAADSSVWVAFCLYLAATFFFAFLAHRKKGKAGFLEDFFVAGRDIGPWVLGLTWLATMASGGTFVGTPSLAHHYGWPVMLWISGYIVLATTGMGVMGKRIAEIGRRTDALTFPDLLRDRYESKWIGVLSGVLVVILHTAYMVAQYVAGARLVEAVLGVPYLWGILGFAFTVAAYTAYGGFRAVAWTDSFQAAVMLFGILLTAYFAIEKAGGLPAVFEALNAESPDLVSLPGPDNFLPLSAAISFFFVWPLSAAGQPLAAYPIPGLPGHACPETRDVLDRSLHSSALPSHYHDGYRRPCDCAGLTDGRPRDSGNDPSCCAAVAHGICASRADGGDHVNAQLIFTGLKQRCGAGPLPAKLQSATQRKGR